MKSLEGHFLVASPYLEDPNFARSVVFIIKHDEDEAFGFIVNRRTKLHLRELIEVNDDSLVDVDQVVYRGGPVNGPIMALHDAVELSEEHVQTGLIISMEREMILELVHRAGTRLRIFYGYAGWGPGQLDQELEQGGWIVTTARTDQIFDDRDDLWESLLIEIGRDIVTAGIDKRILPKDSSCN